jgi:hypothetical protein
VIDDAGTVLSGTFRIGSRKLWICAGHVTPPPAVRSER